ncbi:T9SS type B sorting domain-containing protein [Spirosoma radiotolerans]|uniref:Ig-like domain-containing protein n=1 Tax=Spirosoma radiotolerans TaxID=1379870 RepID=A0A0E3ZTV6_9BACT|nr:gliding motility-associated C-terminal domain-containing protein [Spirosoma radiotolerans]AKD54794.1 hypothetical protein SD10_07625 [Spirosoma radiotolerans]
MGIRNCTGLLCLLFFSYSLSSAQNVAGLWLGATYSSTTGKLLYDYTMMLTQTGNRLTGNTQTASSAGPFSRQATAILSGQLNGSTVAFTESNQDGSLNGNCYWRGTMTYNPVDESLIGTFENIVNGNYCSTAANGNVELYRIALKSGTTFCRNTPARLTVTGKNIRWYSSEAKTNLLATGNTYTPRLNETTTLYITQTLNQAESPAVPITVTITEPIFKFAITNAGCNKNNGAIQVIASNAINWQYSVNAGAFQSSASFTSLSPGSYTVVAKDTAGCQAAHTAIITATADAAPTIRGVQTTPPGCASATGEVSVVAVGGSGPLTYSIDNGGTFQSSPVFSKLAGGGYTVRVRDANGCEVDKAVTLPIGNTLDVNSLISVPTTCGQANGQVSITTSGGRKPVLYSIDNRPFQATALFTNLPAGTYSLLAKDSVGCTVSQSVTVAASTGPQPGAIQTTASTCGEQNGAIRIAPGASTANLMFSLDGQPFQKNSDFNGLKAGTYSLIVRDDNSCVISRSIQIVLDCASVLHLPTAFSPNHDSMNDALTVYFSFPSITVTTFIVYDRWGTVLYNRANFAISSGEPLWDGQLNGQAVPAGMYAYRLDCQFPDGTPMTYRQSVALLY